MKLRFLLSLLSITLLMSCNMGSHNFTKEQLKQQVLETEQAFAKTMADRDFTAFRTFLSEEAVFFSGPKPLHGKQEMVEPHGSLKNLLVILRKCQQILANLRI